MRKELVVLKDMMDGFKILVQDRLQAIDSVNTEDFQTQLAEIRAQVAKLAEKLVQVPTMVMLESLMQFLSQAPSVQSLDDFWGELPKSKSGKKNTKSESLMRSCLLTYPKRTKYNKRNPARLREERQQKLKHLRNNIEMRGDPRTVGQPTVHSAGPSFVSERTLKVPASEKMSKY
uniref:Integrase core domain containing protein n=1 Tax=Solanum tuberosum TaxID=4113 RepID=M1DR09_SOLTU